MLSRQDRQKIVNDYLQETGRNMLVPSEFIDWLKDKTEHPCHGIFFGKSDSEAAQAWRIDQVRSWVSGLRITVTVPEQVRTVIGKITVEEVSLPAAFSPMAGRKESGGYVTTDPKDPQHLQEIAMQGAQAMRQWIERYSGVAALFGIDTSAASKIADKLELQKS